jgi:hypothetical protein
METLLTQHEAASVFAAYLKEVWKGCTCRALVRSSARASVIRYRQSDVEEWIASRFFTSTSQEA